MYLDQFCCNCYWISLGYYYFCTDEIIIAVVETHAMVMNAIGHLVTNHVAIELVVQTV